MQLVALEEPVLEAVMTSVNRFASFDLQAYLYLYRGCFVSVQSDLHDPGEAKCCHTIIITDTATQDLPIQMSNLF